MNEYRIRATGAVVNEGALRAMHENVSLPEVLTKSVLDALGADAVLPSPAPAVNLHQSAVRNGVTQDANGNWVWAWTVRDWTQAEIDAYTASAKAKQWEAIKAERDRRKENGGYKVVVSGVDKWFPSDTFSRVQQIGLVMLGASVQPGLQWKTMDGTFVTMTQALAAQVFAAAASQDIATFAAAETHKAAMEAAADPLAYDFSGGWPAIFAG